MNDFIVIFNDARQNDILRNDEILRRLIKEIIYYLKTEVVDNDKTAVQVRK